MKKNVTFESVLNNLEDVVERLESGDLPLEEALACFEKGIAAAGQCQTMLKDAELKIEQLSNDSAGNLNLTSSDSAEIEDGD